MAASVHRRHALLLLLLSACSLRHASAQLPTNPRDLTKTSKLQTEVRDPFAAPRDSDEIVKPGTVKTEVVGVVQVEPHEPESRMFTVKVSPDDPEPPEESKEKSCCPGNCCPMTPAKIVPLEMVKPKMVEKMPAAPSVTVVTLGSCGCPTCPCQQQHFVADGCGCQTCPCRVNLGSCGCPSCPCQQQHYAASVCGCSTCPCGLRATMPMPMVQSNTGPCGCPSCPCEAQHLATSDCGCQICPCRVVSATHAMSPSISVVTEPGWVKTAPIQTLESSSSSSATGGGGGSTGGANGSGAGAAQGGEGDEEEGEGRGQGGAPAQKKAAAGPAPSDDEPAGPAAGAGSGSDGEGEGGDGEAAAPAGAAAGAAKKEKKKKGWLKKDSQHQDGTLAPNAPNVPSKPQVTATVSESGKNPLAEEKKDKGAHVKLTDPSAGLTGSMTNTMGASGPAHGADLAPVPAEQTTGAFSDVLPASQVTAHLSLGVRNAEDAVVGQGSDVNGFAPSVREITVSGDDLGKLDEGRVDVTTPTLVPIPGAGQVTWIKGPPPKNDKEAEEPVDTGEGTEPPKRRPSLEWGTTHVSATVGASPMTAEVTKAAAALKKGQDPDAPPTPQQQDSANEQAQAPRFKQQRHGIRSSEALATRSTQSVEESHPTNTASSAATAAGGSNKEQGRKNVPHNHDAKTADDKTTSAQHVDGGHRGGGSAGESSVAAVAETSAAGAAANAEQSGKAGDGEGAGGSTGRSSDRKLRYDGSAPVDSPQGAVSAPVFPVKPQRSAASSSQSAAAVLAASFVSAAAVVLLHGGTL